MARASLSQLSLAADQQTLAGHPQKAQLDQRSRRTLPPQAPSSDVVAQRILAHARAVPIKRFDSADFFLDQFKQKRKMAHPPAEEDEAPTRIAAPDDMSDEVAMLLEPPPPTRLVPAVRSPPLPFGSSASPCGSPVLRTRRS